MLRDCVSKFRIEKLLFGYYCIILCCDCVCVCMRVRVFALCRQAMQVFLLARQLIVNILGERELYLPLMATDGRLKVDDRPDLSE